MNWGQAAAFQKKKACSIRISGEKEDDFQALLPVLSCEHMYTSSCIHTGAHTGISTMHT